MFLLEVKLPYLAHKTLYVINTTRAGPRETANSQVWLKAAPGQWVDQPTSADRPLYFTSGPVAALPQGVGGEEDGCVAEVAGDSPCQSRATHEQDGAGEQPVQAPPDVLGHGGPVDEGDVGWGHQPAGPGLEEQPCQVNQGERRGHLGQEHQGPGAVPGGPGASSRPDGGDGRVQLAGGDPLPSQRHEDQIDPVNKDTKRVAEKTMKLKINLVKVMKDICKNTKLVPIIRGVVG